VAVLSGEALVLLALLTLTPGADTFLTLRQALAGGLRAAVPTIAGIQVGLLVHASLAGLGLSLLLAEWPAAFRTVQLAGVGYLAYLGVRSLLAARRAPSGPASPPTTGHAFRDGLLTNLLNPKVALFYVGFLPQYIPDTQPFFLTALLYGLVHDLMGEVQLTAVAVAAHALRRRVTSPRFLRGSEAVAGVVLLLFALRLALAKA
jgi:threonine/homoserine/homoserine lactone efflux protein